MAVSMSKPDNDGITMTRAGDVESGEDTTLLDALTADEEEKKRKAAEEEAARIAAEEEALLALRPNSVTAGDYDTQAPRIAAETAKIRASSVARPTYIRGQDGPYPTITYSMIPEYTDRLDVVGQGPTQAAPGVTQVPVYIRGTGKPGVQDPKVGKGTVDAMASMVAPKNLPVTGDPTVDAILEKQAQITHGDTILASQREAALSPVMQSAESARDAAERANRLYALSPTKENKAKVESTTNILNLAVAKLTTAESAFLQSKPVYEWNASKAGHKAELAILDERRKSEQELRQNKIRVQDTLNIQAANLETLRSVAEARSAGAAKAREEYKSLYTDKTLAIDLEGFEQSLRDKDAVAGIEVLRKLNPKLAAMEYKEARKVQSLTDRLQREHDFFISTADEKADIELRQELKQAAAMSELKIGVADKERAKEMDEWRYKQAELQLGRREGRVEAAQQEHDRFIRNLLSKREDKDSARAATNAEFDRRLALREAAKGTTEEAKAAREWEEWTQERIAGGKDVITPETQQIIGSYATSIRELSKLAPESPEYAAKSQEVDALASSLERMAPMMMHKEAAATKRLVDRIGATRDLAVLRQEQALARRRTPDEQAALTSASLTAKGKYEVERINSAFSAGEISLYRDANDGLSPGAAVARMRKDPTKDEDIAHTRYFYNRGNPRKMTAVHTVPLSEEQRDFASRVLQGQAASQTDKQYIEGYAKNLGSVRYSATVKPFIEPDPATGKIRLPGGVQHPNPSLALRLEDLYKSYTTAAGDKARGEILVQMQEVQSAILSNPAVTGRAITESTMRYMKDVFLANSDKLLPVLLASTVAAGVKSPEQKRAIAGAVEVLKIHPWEDPVALVEAVSRGLMFGVVEPSERFDRRQEPGYSDEIIPPVEAKDKALKLVTKAMEQVDSYTGSAITGSGGFDLPALLTYTTQQVRVQTFFERLGLTSLFHDAPPPMPAPYAASTSGTLPPPPIEIGKPATLYAR